MQTSAPAATATTRARLTLISTRSTLVPALAVIIGPHCRNAPATFAGDGSSTGGYSPALTASCQGAIRPKMGSSPSSRPACRVATRQMKRVLMNSAQSGSRSSILSASIMPASALSPS